MKGLDLGAEDYITKPFSVRELKARINTALRRIAPEAQRIELGGLVLQPDARAVTLDGQQIELTLQDVWGYQAQTDASRTVDYHIRALRVKLGEDVRQPRFIQTVHGSGYRMRKED